MARKRLSPYEIERLGSLEWKKGTHLTYPIFLQIKKLLKKGIEKQTIFVLTGVSPYQIWMIKSGRIDKTRWKKTSKNIKNGK